MLIVFLHGWSVTDTATYGGLPDALAAQTGKDPEPRVQHLFLAKYVSFADEVSVDDLARGLQHAVTQEVLPLLARGERFACITHSTGGPVARTWIHLFHKHDLARCPMDRLIMLAPANHGSALAQLGKSRLARMKFFASGVQPGIGVLDWLELGSGPSWDLNLAWLELDGARHGLYIVVLTGQSIDRHEYDSLNAYTGEAGSDGVVRVASANPNYGVIRLAQQGGTLRLSKQGRSMRTAFGILPGCSHSGAALGIMASVPASGAMHPTLTWVRRSLAVRSLTAYRRLAKDLDRLTTRTQAQERAVRRKDVFPVARTFITNRYGMFVFRIVDDRGNELADYDVVFTAGPQYDANHLAPGFFKDRQRNQRHPGKLVYYIDYDVMAEWLAKPALDGRFGLRVTARPAQGYAHYTVAEYRGALSDLARYFEPNQTLMVEITLTRHVAEGIFRLTQDRVPHGFADQPTGDTLP